MRNSVMGDARRHSVEPSLFVNIGALNRSLHLYDVMPLHPV